MEDELGVIGEATENGFPIIYSFIKELPLRDVMSSLPLLVVIKRKYEGNELGFPDKLTQDKIYELENYIEKLERSNCCYRAYGRTGENSKEMVYYTSSQSFFMEQFNKLLANKPTYPIEITFYEDEDWSDYKEVLSDFNYG